MTITGKLNGWHEHPLLIFFTSWDLYLNGIRMAKIEKSSPHPYLLWVGMDRAFTAGIVYPDLESAKTAAVEMLTEALGSLPAARAKMKT